MAQLRGARVTFDTTIAIALMFLGGIPETPTQAAPLIPAPTTTLLHDPRQAPFGGPVTHR